jgi:hypothetical protein
MPPISVRASGVHKKLRLLRSIARPRLPQINITGEKHMSSPTWKRSTGFLIVSSLVLLGACASNDDVKRAQATADQALQQAQAANQAALAANQRADAATQQAQAANQRADAATARADRMYEQSLKK